MGSIPADFFFYLILTYLTGSISAVFFYLIKKSAGILLPVKKVNIK
jgi:hypothetical protein